MLGAILGDIIGSPYEGRNAILLNANDFLLFHDSSRFTDDTVMTIAVCDGIMSSYRSSDEKMRKAIISSMRDWGKRYPHAGYGSNFKKWLTSNNPRPYGSWANGSAMRVSSVGWLYDSLPRTLEVAKITAEVTHNHPDAIKGAQAVAGAIFLARSGASKHEIKQFAEREFGYNLNKTLAELIPIHTFDMTCAGTVRDAFVSFLESTDFESAVRNAVALGGDTDTIGAVTGSIAEAFYGIPETLMKEAAQRIWAGRNTEEIGSQMLSVLVRFFINRFDDFTTLRIEPERINNNSIAKLDPNNIWACSASGSGAMGDAGTVNILYADDKRKVHYLYANWVNDEIDINKFENIFTPLREFDKTGKMPKGWEFYYLGCGNSLFLKTELYKKLEPFIMGVPEYEMYGMWLRLAKKVLAKMLKAK